MRPKRYIKLPRSQRRVVSVVLGGYVILLVNSLLLYLFDRSTALVYMSSVLLHIVLGLLLIVPLVVFLVLHLAKMPIRMNWRATGAGFFTALSLSVLLSTGIALVSLGSSFEGGWVLWLHVATAVTSVIGFVAHVSLKRGLKYHFLDVSERWKRNPVHVLRHPLGATLAAGLVVSAIFIAVPWMSSRPGVFVQYAGVEQQSSQATLAHEGFLSDADLARSETCGQAGCHPDIFAQWSESAHRFSSFNNPYYRKSIEAMIERKGNGPTRWCASCHDPLVLFTGRFADDVPVDMDHWTAQEGLTCLSCHAIDGLRDVTGNGRFVISSPDEYPFARAEAGAGKWVHNVLVRSKPEPHRRAMLKPVHQTPEFCGSCHKVGIPPDVNDYRWKRGQNEYDGWHASGASGNTVRSFYLPPQAATCASCHMPPVRSDDQGNKNGFVKSHRFAFANTALPLINGHPDQLEAVQRMLKDDIIAIEIFHLQVNGRRFDPDEPTPPLRPGDDVFLSVVLRNLKVGHPFPGGTNDSNELWVELQAKDPSGRIVLSSGHLDDATRVDSSAHFLGSVLVDRASRPIDKRNAHDWITTVYANTIGPGSARTVHYRFRIPTGAPVVELTASLKHRKFKWYFNEWTFGGRVADGEPDSLARGDVDLRRWVLDSGRAPEIPITTMATASRVSGEPTRPSKDDRPMWERWNDYGIGLLMEGDTRGALGAFQRVTTMALENPEGPINEARVLIEEGQLGRAAASLDEADRRRAGYLKTAYFRGEVHRQSGLYDEALREWMAVYEQYPKDRVLVLGIGRVHYLAGRYEEAIRWFDMVLAIDPESVGALYNRMLALGALGRDVEFQAAREQYEYFKDDEDAAAIASPFKMRHPMPNREAQAVHEHELWQVP